MLGQHITVIPEPSNGGYKYMKSYAKYGHRYSKYIYIAELIKFELNFERLSNGCATFINNYCVSRYHTLNPGGGVLKYVSYYHVRTIWVGFSLKFL